jgi:hypothetical protein
MGRLLRIPYLVDLIRTDVPAEIRAYGADKRLDRDFMMRGPLLNRLLTRKLRTVLTLHGLPLPAVAPQSDPDRVRSHGELCARLAVPSGGFDDQTIAGLARAVRGYGDAPVLEHAVQQAVGRLFVDNYRADEQSYAAAVFLDHAVHSMNPLAGILWRITGKLTQAQDLLAQKVHGDRAGVHATGIAVHNLVRGFVEMRRLLAPPNSPDPAASDRLVARCLKAPAGVLREVVPDCPSLGDPVRSGTLVVLDLAAAQEREPNPDIVFMKGTWAECPAAGWVPALLRAVWDRALELPPPTGAPVGGPFRISWSRAEAARRVSNYRRLLGINLALQVALGIALLANPGWLSGGPAASFVRILGLMLVLLGGIYAVGLLDPIRTRWPNILGLVGRCATAALYLTLAGKFLWLAAFDLAFAGALAWSYWHAFRAELMTRP